jgi:hypothetical protein
MINTQDHEVDGNMRVNGIQQRRDTRMHEPEADG